MTPIENRKALLIFEQSIKAALELSAQGANLRPDLQNAYYREVIRVFTTLGALYSETPEEAFEHLNHINPELITTINNIITTLEHNNE